MKDLLRYRRLTKKDAADLAHRDFLQSDENAPPRNCKPHRTARFHAVHFLFHTARKEPNLLTSDTLSDLMRGYSECNTHTRLGIIKICEATRHPGTLLFLAYVRGGGFGSESLLRQFADEAINVVNEAAFIGIGEDYQRWVQLVGPDGKCERPPLALRDNRQDVDAELGRGEEVVSAEGGRE